MSRSRGNKAVRRYAAFASASLHLAKAQSSQSVSASTSARSTVEPHQLRACREAVDKLSNATLFDTEGAQKWAQWREREPGRVQ